MVICLLLGGVSYEGITITIGEGSDWFDAEELTPAAIVIINGLFDRYKEVSGLMQDYLQGSDEYNAYKNEIEQYCSGNEKRRHGGVGPKRQSD